MNLKNQTGVGKPKCNNEEDEHKLIVSDMGQFYKYTDCCGTIHIQSFPFRKEQIEKIEKEAKKILDVFVEDVTDEINKRVLERIINSKNK